MLALRLQGSRSIRANSSGASCRAHITCPSVNGRGRPHAPTRAYAQKTGSNDSNVEASNEFLKVTRPLPTHRERNTPRSPAHGSLGRKPFRAPLGEDDPLNTLKIIRDSADLLKQIQTNPDKFAGRPNTQESVKIGEEKYDLRQNKILQSTMKVLQDALLLHVRATAERSGPPGSAEEAVTRAAKETLANVNGWGEPIAKSAKSSRQSSKRDAELEAEEIAQPVGSNAQLKKKPVLESAKEPKQRADAAEKEKALRNAKEARQKAEADKNKIEAREAKQKAAAAEAAKKKKEQALQAAQEAKQKADPAAGSPNRKQRRERAALEQETTHFSQGQLEKTPPSEVSDAVSASLAYVVASAKAAKANSRSTPTSQQIEDAGTDWMAKAGADITETVKVNWEKTKKKHNVDVKTFSADPVSAMSAVEVDMPPVPMIQHGLDRVLFKEGVYNLQDPRTRVWNFDPFLANIMPVSEFDFEALKEYTTSSKDKKLIGVTKKQGKKYTGSTSSLTASLAHFHFLLSHWRMLNHSQLSKSFEGPEFGGLSNILTAPAATFLNYKDGVYAIDADKEWDTDTILSMLGHSMEKLLTVPKAEFEMFSRTKSHLLNDDQKGQDQAYHYSTYGDFLMRSQLDAYDPRLPGTGVFDVKTRAVVSIRSDAVNHENGQGYEIRQLKGNWESYEREQYDLARSAFLKYSLQVRMGRMDGIFVAYHNTERIFGFQYIPTEEMDLVNHGTADKTLGDLEFTASVKMFNDLLNQATERFPKQSLRVWVEARKSEGVPFLYFFAEPVTEAAISAVQDKRAGDIDAFREKLGIVSRKPLNAQLDQSPEKAPAVKKAEVTQDSEQVEVKDPERDREEIWEDMMDVVEATMEKDAEGITAIRDAIQEALEQSGLLQAKSAEEAEHYVETLLRSIVDTDAEVAEAEEEPAKPEPIIPTKSGLSSLFSWFSPKEPEPPIKETSQEDIAPTSSKPSPELVDLLVKLTSRVGMTTKNGKKSNRKGKQQELSDEQAKIQDFETILAEMMPKVVEDAKTKAEEHETISAKRTGSPAPQKNQLFAMVVSVRNKVNGHNVVRPEKLRHSDKWEIEYAMEAIKPDTAQRLLKQAKGRRRMAMAQTPSAPLNEFLNPRKKRLLHLTAAGKAFREEETEIARKKPVYVVGQRQPFAPTAWTKNVGPLFRTVLPSLDAPRPNPEPYPGRIEQAPIEYVLPRSSQNPEPEPTSPVEEKDPQPGPLFTAKEERSPKVWEQEAKQATSEPAISRTKEQQSTKTAAPPKPAKQEKERKAESPKAPLSKRDKSAVSDEEANMLSTWLSSQSEMLAAAVKKSKAKPESKEKGDNKGAAIANTVAELRETEEVKAMSFKEWREKSKQK